MEKREKNIFYNIIKNETSLTEVFCNIMQYKVFRELFLSIVNEKIEALEGKKLQNFKINYDNFSTELNLKNENEKLGRADLILKVEEEYIFELKIERYTHLTEHQPESYLKYLKNDNLFFILPKHYRHKDEICTRWHNATEYPIDKIKHHLIYWEDILKKIKDKELDKINLLISEFCNILDYRWFYYPSIKFSNYEIELIFKKQNNVKNKKDLMMSMDSNIPKIMNKLFEVIEGVDDKLDTTKDGTKTESYYGYILKDKRIPEKWEVWFGVDYEIWENEQLPLTIQVYSDDADEMDKIIKLGIFKKYTYKEDKDITTFVALNASDFEKENIVEIFTDKINEIIDKLKQT